MKVCFCLFFYIYNNCVYKFLMKICFIFYLPIVYICIAWESQKLFLHFLCCYVSVLFIEQVFNKCDLYSRFYKVNYKYVTKNRHYYFFLTKRNKNVRHALTKCFLPKVIKSSELNNNRSNIFVKKETKFTKTLNGKKL